MKEKILKSLDIIIPVVTVICVASASIYLYTVRKDYKEADDEYNEIAEYAMAEDFSEEMIEADGAAQAADFGEAAAIDEDGGGMNGEAEDEEGAAGNAETFRNLHINFDMLESVNPEVVGWISVPDIFLSYPVLQHEDNSYYLHHTFKGNPNSAGCIILDSSVKADMTSLNTFVYGHAMKNGTMFGTLKQFRGNDELLDKAYIYYYTKDHAFRYKVFATYIVATNSFAYYYPEDLIELENYIEKVQAVNTYEKGREIKPWDVERVITLSTCSGVSGSGKRTIVQGYLVDEYEY